MNKTWILLLLSAVFLVIVIGGFSLLNLANGEDITATTRLDAAELDTEGFAVADSPYDWQFPQDFGAHENFQTEWWYYTGNVATEDGRRFGYQFTIFRRALTADTIESDSEWRNNQAYMAHFTVSDISVENFYHEQRVSRGSADLAGATFDPRYEVWIDDWQISALDDAAEQVRIQADTPTIAIDVTLTQVKPPALQGDAGLSAKSDATASYYYTLSRLETTGTLRIGADSYTISGNTWKDHEFSTRALGADVQGWDWFGLIFDDGSEMMLGQIRRTDGSLEPEFGGMLIRPDGSTEYLAHDSFTLDVRETWTSPHTEAVYPAGWDITVITSTETINFTVTPLLADQELYDTDPAYWEGAVQISGDVTGYGYAELTGYADSMQNRF